MVDHTDRTEAESPESEGLVLPGSDSLYEDEDRERESAENGLDVDDRQSAEIREIFGTTFPQYLQPVEEILKQVLSGEGDDESLEALKGMLKSLESASSHMGFENVNELLRRLIAQVDDIGEDRQQTLPPEAREEILGGLLELKDLAEEMRGDMDPAPEAQQQTIFTALKGKEGVGELVLKRLSTAGVITVDQLLQAKPEEIAAVSGLDLKIVNRLQKMLLADAPEEVREEATAAGSKAAKMPPELEALHEQVLKKLRGEAEIEAALEGLRAEIRTLRSRIATHREELGSLKNTLKEKRKSLKRVSLRQGIRATVLDELCVRRDALARKTADSEERLNRKEVKIKALCREKRALEKQKVSLSREVYGLVGSLGRVQRSFAKEGKDDRLTGGH